MKAPLRKVNKAIPGHGGSALLLLECGHVVRKWDVVLTKEVQPKEATCTKCQPE